MTTFNTIIIIIQFNIHVDILIYTRLFFKTDISMENLDSFKKARVYFKTWSSERQNILEELRRIKDEIQRQDRIHTIGSITYSSVGLVGGGLAIAGIVTAPFTFGASLALTVAGVATGVTSGVAGVTHGVVKLGIVRKQCQIAERSLKKHNETCEEMKKIINKLTNDMVMKDCHSLETSHVWECIKRLIQIGYIASVEIPDLVQKCQAVSVYSNTGNINETNKVLSSQGPTKAIVQSVCKDVSQGVTKLSIVLVAAGIIVDLGSLIYNAINLAKFEKGKLCTVATKLQRVIKQMEDENEVLNNFLKKICKIP